MAAGHPALTAHHPSVAHVAKAPLVEAATLIHTMEAAVQVLSAAAVIMAHSTVMEEVAHLEVLAVQARSVEEDAAEVRLAGVDKERRVIK